jgi:predicted metal-dependent hydrolase
MKIFLDGQEFEVEHRSNKKIKRISLVLETKSLITVKTPPKIKAHQIRDIVLHHKDWILNTIHKAPSKNKFDFLVGSKLPLLGEKYPIKFIEDDKYKNVKIDFKVDHFEIYHNPQIHKEYDQYHDGLKRFYKIHAQKIIDPLFDQLCFQTKLNPENITYRFAKTRWGSCSYKNDISINYMLLQFPLEAILYVVLHELCHIEEKNHSKRFWNLVSLYMPQYKAQEEVLKSKLF